MNNKIFTTGEILTIQANLREIEKNLGYHIPGGMIDASDLKDHILRPGEVLTICQNINNIKRGNRRSTYRNDTPSRFELWIFYGALIVGFLSYLFDWF